MLPSGQLWLPAAGLSACVRATVVRNTVGHVLTDAQRFNLETAVDRSHSA